MECDFHVGFILCLVETLSMIEVLILGGRNEPYEISIDLPL